MNSLRSNIRSIVQMRKQGTSRMDTVVVQGGAGDMPDAVVERRLQGVQTAAHEAYITLKETGNVLDSVERAIRIMEANEAFNAGYGSYLTEKGEVELDACIMEGSELTAGACCTVKDIKHPITLARVIMLKTKHVMLVGEGAMRFAHDNGFEKMKPGSLVSKSAREYWEKNKSMIEEEPGSVGAVVRDKQGKVAAGMSVGGQNGRISGECSDAAYIGSGVYADNLTGAVCCTGTGNSIAKLCLAFAIAKNITNMPLMEAIQSKLKVLEARMQQKAGVITISKTGEVGISFTTPKMVWAYQRGRSVFYGTKQDEVLEMQM